MYQPYERQKSRDRSRDRDRRFGGRSPSEDDGGMQRKERGRFVKGRGKRVKFEGSDDIRVFRKEDEPTARGLLEEDIFKIKAEIEKEIAKSYDFNWEHYKHRDALLESNSMKEQKEREKALSEKLMAAKELIAYTFPLRLAKIEQIIEPGCDSLQKEAHTSRIHDILGCYYTHASEIPNEPAFEILNTHPAPQPKIIKFDNDLFPDEPTTTRKTQDNSRPIKGILKIPGGDRAVERSRSESRQIDPQLIYLLRDFKLNPQLYTKEKMEVMLKPYRDSGELDYLTKNKEVLEAMLKSASAGGQGKPVGPSQYPKQSAERSGSSQPTSMGVHGQHNFVPKADKFRTVPCKYYHSSQGCSKIDNCTFIHDERYSGVPVPGGQSGPSTGPMPARLPPPYNPYGNPPSHYYNPPPSNPGYYNPSMGYAPPYPSYGAPSASYQGGYPSSKPPGPSGPSSSQPYSNPGYTQAQGYTPGGQSQGYGGGGQGQGQGQGQGYPGGGRQAPPGQGYPGGQPSQGQYPPVNPAQGQYSNPNYQYYIGGNPPK